MPERAIEEFRVAEEPYYLPVGGEIDLFEAAHAAQLPVILKGPTGCGKTRFVEHMAWRLERPLITVACHEDLSATDLVGRFLLEGEETVWHDGPLTSAVRNGAICYLDEVVEARKDTVVIIHPLTDHRRRLPIEKRGTDPRRAGGFHAGCFLQSGLSIDSQRLEAIDAPTLCGDRFRLSAAGTGNRDRRARRRRRRRHGARSRPDRTEGAQPARPRLGRRRFDASADLRRATDCPRHPAGHRRGNRDVLAHHRRSRIAAQHPRNRDDGDLGLVTVAS